MQTKRLYYEDAYRKTFTGTVTGTGTDERGDYVLLDQTLFFPEGGGQPADTGILNGISVRDVQESGEEIRHYITRLEASLQTGDSVEGEINWDRRFDLMQQHSGEHIVSGLIHARFGYDNVGFHMGERFITIDLNGDISREELASVEACANDYIWQNRETRMFFATEEEIRTLPYRSKLDLTEEVRLAEFPGADLCACCGLHVKNTGEIGLIKLISVHHFRQGVRIEMVSGKRALACLNTHFEQNSLVASDLSAKPENTFEAVTHIKEENFRLRGEILRLEKEKYERIAARCEGLSDVWVSVPDLSPVDIRKCADEILNVNSGVCVLVSGDDELGYRYAAGVRQGDVRALVKEMNIQLKGRGGGKPIFAQGTFKAALAEAECFFTGKGFTPIIL